VAEEARQVLSDYLVGMDGELASERICAEIDRQFLASRESPSARIARDMRRVRHRARERVKSLIGRKPAAEPASLESFRRQRFPGLDRQELEAMVATLTRISHRFRHVAVSPIPGTTSCHALHRA
jgi:hypothetical protein